MKKVFYLLLIGGAMLICPHQSKADPYYLVRTIKHKGQLSPRPITRLRQDHSVLTLQLMSLLYQKM